MRTEGSPEQSLRRVLKAAGYRMRKSRAPISSDNLGGYMDRGYVRECGCGRRPLRADFGRGPGVGARHVLTAAAGWGRSSLSCFA